MQQKAVLNAIFLAMQTFLHRNIALTDQEKQSAEIPLHTRLSEMGLNALKVPDDNSSFEERAEFSRKIVALLKNMDREVEAIAYEFGTLLLAYDTNDERKYECRNEIIEISSKLDLNRNEIVDLLDSLETSQDKSAEIKFNYFMDILKQLEEPNKNKIFIVHGHDNGMREAVKAFVSRLDLEPVILNEMASKGMTIIEKFETYSDVQYAIVLLSPDDIAFSKIKIDNQEERARQNVILELGYFVGKLGRSRVCLLIEGSIDIPSDFQGVVHIKFDEHEGWQKKVIIELKDAGYTIDANKLI